MRTVIAHNVGSESVDLVGLEWTANDVPIKADRLLHNGYQSWWSYTGIEAIPASIVDRAGTAANGGADGDVLGESSGVSWWVGALMDNKGDGLVAGADAATVLKTYVAADAQRLRCGHRRAAQGAGHEPGVVRALDERDPRGGPRSAPRRVRRADPAVRRRVRQHAHRP